jgi:sterol desaturase/sphingolipid hydroxylase (fatty acid hydroxylase superfamily)
MWNQPYWVYLAIISLFFLLVERLRPWRHQPLLRKYFDTDLLYLAFNGHFLALLMAPVTLHVKPHVDAFFIPLFGQGYVSGLPLWVQGLIAFFAIDFIKWSIHVMLHHVSWLWTFHRVHHSIVDMDWIGNMRFHWMEIVIYDGILYVPMILLGFDWKVLLFMALVSTVIGHFNHSNLRLKLGPLKYFFNHPGMHIWHHDYVMRYRAGCNFGINLSIWDWIFRTAYYPTDVDQPERLGFHDIEKFPTSFVSQQLAPLTTMRSKNAFGS